MRKLFKAENNLKTGLKQCIYLCSRHFVNLKALDVCARHSFCVHDGLRAMDRRRLKTELFTLSTNLRGCKPLMSIFNSCWGHYYYYYGFFLPPFT